MPTDSTQPSKPIYKLPLWNIWLTMVLRFFVGGVFIFSGFVKAVDPWGTIYKMNDYMAAMNFSLPDSIVTIAAFTLFILEFLIGIFLIFGCYRKLAPTAAMLMMIVMLPVTLWIAIYNPVADCGCFGDAIYISNWETFFKNIILTAMIVWLFIYANKSRCFIIPTMQWLAFATSVIFMLIIGIYGYMYQPLLDFRPYPIGESLIEEYSTDETETQFRFIYEKDGRQQSFTADDIPESDDWVFVDREEITANKQTDTGNQQQKQLRIYDNEGNDVTEFVISPETDQLILFFSSLADVSIASTYQINSLYSYCLRHKISMIAVASASDDELNTWNDLSMPSYKIFTAEDTSIKEVVRGNPAVVYLEKGIVKWKSSLRAIDVDDFLADTADADPMSFARNNNSILRNNVTAYSLAMLLIVVLSHVPMAVRFAKRQIRFRNLVKDDTD